MENLWSMQRTREEKRAAIFNSLRSLQAEKFHEFCHKLIDPNEESRIWVSEVESKSRADITDLLISRCTDSRAVDRTIRTLKGIGCYNEAHELGLEVEEGPRRRKRSPPRHRPANTKAIDGPSAANSVPANQGHFLDRHRSELIDRVSNMGPILDHLLQEGVLQQEQYNRAMDLSPPQAQMRFLLSGPVRSAGDRGKEVLMEALCMRETALVKDLWKQEA